MISHQCGYNVGRRDLQIVRGSALWSCPCHVWKCLKLGNLPNATRVESQGLIAQISHRYRVMFQVSRCFHVSSSHKFGLAVLWYLTIFVISRVTRHRPLPQSKFLAPLKSNGFNKTMSSDFCVIFTAKIIFQTLFPKVVPYHFKNGFKFILPSNFNFSVQFVRFSNHLNGVKFS